jgi:hypothetical protein
VCFTSSRSPLSLVPPACLLAAQPQRFQAFVGPGEGVCASTPWFSRFEVEIPATTRIGRRIAKGGHNGSPKEDTQHQDSLANQQIYLWGHRAGSNRALQRCVGSQRRREFSCGVDRENECRGWNTSHRELRGPTQLALHGDENRIIDIHGPRASDTQTERLMEPGSSMTALTNTSVMLRVVVYVYKDSVCSCYEPGRRRRTLTCLESRSQVTRIRQAEVQTTSIVNILSLKLLPITPVVEGAIQCSNQAKPCTHDSATERQSTSLLQQQQQ